jgi:hypothetical protein
MRPGIYEQALFHSCWNQSSTGIKKCGTNGNCNYFPLSLQVKNGISIGRMVSDFSDTVIPNIQILDMVLT